MDCAGCQAELPQPLTRATRSCPCLQVHCCSRQCAVRILPIHRYYCALGGGFGWLTCDHCGYSIPVAPPALPSRCPCSRALYCDELCQKRHWKVHRRDCSARAYKEVKRLVLALAFPSRVWRNFLRPLLYGHRKSPWAVQDVATPFGGAWKGTRVERITELWAQASLAGVYPPSFALTSSVFDR